MYFYILCVKILSDLFFTKEASMPLHKINFKKTLQFLATQGLHPDESVATEAIARVSSIWTGSQPFRELFDPVIDQMIEQGLLKTEDRRTYILVLGQYFNKQAMLARGNKISRNKNSWIPKVLEVEAGRVLIKVYPELNIEFYIPRTVSAEKALHWGDVLCRKDVLSGSSFVGDNTFQSVKRQALAILERRRKLTTSTTSSAAHCGE
jgi:hypothetical protein